MTYLVRKNKKSLSVDLHNKKQALDKVDREYRELLRKHEGETEYPRALKLVGTVWMTNREVESDYWTIYLRVMKASIGGFVVYQRMQINQSGVVNLEPSMVTHWGRLLSGEYGKSTKSEWNAELRRHKKNVEEV
jgi:hypothetical protein